MESQPLIEPTRSMTLVLMSLSKQPKHGYAIMNEIADLTAGEYIVNAGTLYRSISQMLLHGLIQEAPELFKPRDDERRKYYKITEHGVTILLAEIKRIESLLRAAETLGIR